MPEPLSKANKDVLEHVFKRPIKAGTKITLTVESLGQVLDACRVDERAALIERQLEGMIDTLKGAA